MNKFFAAILIAVLPYSLYSQSAGQSFPNKETGSKILNLEEKETPARRAEVVFLISFPFTVLMSFVLYGGMYLVSNPGFSFSMVDLPPEILPLSIISGLFTSGVITYNDYLMEEKRKKESTSEINESHEFKYGISLNGHF